MTAIKSAQYTSATGCHPSKSHATLLPPHEYFSRSAPDWLWYYFHYFHKKTQVTHEPVSLLCCEWMDGRFVTESEDWTVAWSVWTDPGTKATRRRRVWGMKTNGINDSLIFFIALERFCSGIALILSLITLLLLRSLTGFYRLWCEWWRELRTSLVELLQGGVYWV